MQNEKNDTKTHVLKVEKTIQKPATDVFKAISEGRLFLNCSASNETLQVDFRVGGKYHLDFQGHGIYNGGEFLEIIQNKKIVFTWRQVYESNAASDTTVTIELKDLGEKTHLTLTHAGFTSPEGRDQHQGGWTGGLEDLSEEISKGRLRLVRPFKVPVEKLYQTCADPISFFGLVGEVQDSRTEFKVGGSFFVKTQKGEVKGQFLEIVPNQKIIFSWSGCEGPLESKVTLLFDKDDEEENESWLELIHEGLTTEALQKSHREGWDYILNRVLHSHPSEA